MQIIISFKQQFISLIPFLCHGKGFAGFAALSLFIFSLKTSHEVNGGRELLNVFFFFKCAVGQSASPKAVSFGYWPS